MNSRFLRYPYSFVLYATCTLALFGTLYAQQSGERIVSAIDDIERITDAVLISNVAVGGKTVECGLFIKPPVENQPVTPFQAGPDWLSQMTISLVNRTDETIAFGSILFHFLDTGDCQALPCIGTELHFGKRPVVDAYDGRSGKPLKLEDSEKTPLDWKPRQTIVVHVSDYMGDIERNLSYLMSVAAVRRLKVYRGVFYFADGMQWSLGRYAVPDSAHPGKFKELPEDYFPGRRGNNWPPGYDY
jgi:hypothetical protein